MTLWRSLKSHAIKPLADPLRFKLAKKIARVSDDGLIILSTITKTGTHYLRAAIVLHHFKSAWGMAMSDFRPDSIDIYLPNNYHNHYLFPKNRPKISREKKFSCFIDMPRSHLEYQAAWRRTRVLHTFRHPFNFVSAYFLYKVKADPRLTDVRGDQVTKDLAKNLCNRFSLEYRTHAEMQGRLNPHLLKRVHFDELYMQPVANLKAVFDWIGLKSTDSDCETIHKFLVAHYPNLAAGAGEAWMRNGSGNISKLGLEQEQFFLANGYFDYESFWTDDAITHVRQVSVDLGFPAGVS